MGEKQPDPVIIVPPQGFEVDTEKSTSGKIMFREVKKQSYDSIIALMVANGTLNVGVMDRNNKKLRAIQKLLNMAHYLNEKGVSPRWHISIDNGEIKIIGAIHGFQTMGTLFTSKEVAQQALEILGEDVIRMALCQDY